MNKQEQLKLMHRNALRLLNLVNQLLDFRKNEVAGAAFESFGGGCIVCSLYMQLIPDAFGKEKRASHFFLGNRIVEYVVR